MLHIEGVKSSVICAFSFAGCVATNFPDAHNGVIFGSLSGIYYTTLQFAFISSMISVVVCTITAAFGPSLALNGKSEKLVVYGNLHFICLI
jgi:hypothetical protein